MSQVPRGYDEEAVDEIDSVAGSVSAGEHTRLNPASRIGVIHSFPLALQNLIKKTVIVMLFQAVSPLFAHLT